MDDYDDDSHGSDECEYYYYNEDLGMVISLDDASVDCDDPSGPKTNIDGPLGFQAANISDDE
jgi:hypothetical protein